MASLVNACSTALINAGSVPMRGVVCAVSVGRLPGSDESFNLVLDPSETELPSLVGGGCFVFMFSSILTASPNDDASDIPSASLLWTNYTATSGRIDDAELAQAQAIALQGAREIWKVIKNSLSSPREVYETKARAEDVEPARPPSPELDDAAMEI